MKCSTQKTTMRSAKLSIFRRPRRYRYSLTETFLNLKRCGAHRSFSFVTMNQSATNFVDLT